MKKRTHNGFFPYRITEDCPGLVEHPAMASPSHATRRTSSTGDALRKRKAVSDEENTDYHDDRSSQDNVGDDGPSRLSNVPVANKRARTNPPPSTVRDIPCLPCVGRGVKTPGHLCRDYGQGRNICIASTRKLYIIYTYSTKYSPASDNT